MAIRATMLVMYNTAIKTDMHLSGIEPDIECKELVLE